MAGQTRKELRIASGLALFAPPYLSPSLIIMGKLLLPHLWTKASY
jgi:hypothetical protein